MSIAIVNIGTELTRGEIDNTNASWLSQQVTARGLEVSTIEVVGDAPERIGECLRRLGREHDVIVCTGGLGPTTDDLTSLSVARLLDVELLRDEPSLEKLRERYAKRGVAFGESNAKQADFPRGATILTNDWGTAPGFSIHIERAVAFFFPGVPRELKPMFQRDVVPQLEQLTGDSFTAQVRLRTFGAPESKVNDLLAGVEEQFNVVIGYRAHFPEIDVKPMATRTTRQAAEADARRAADEIHRCLGQLVYAEGDLDLPVTVTNLLRKKQWSVGFAESCTGGLVSALLTAESCSDVYKGAIVSYANEVKRDVLGVHPEDLEQAGAVSEPVVRQMAAGARRVLAADVALSVSGIAGPGGGTEDKPVGLVHFAVETPQTTLVHHAIFPHERTRVQRWAAFVGFNLIRKTLLGQC